MRSAPRRVLCENVLAATNKPRAAPSPKIAALRPSKPRHWSQPDQRGLLLPASVRCCFRLRVQPHAPSRNACGFRSRRASGFRLQAITFRLDRCRAATIQAPSRKQQRSRSGFRLRERQAAAPSPIDPASGLQFSLRVVRVFCTRPFSRLVGTIHAFRRA